MEFIAQESQIGVISQWGDVMEILNGVLKELFRRTKFNLCWYCGCELPTEDAVTSGWDYQ